MSSEICATETPSSAGRHLRAGSATPPGGAKRGQWPEGSSPMRGKQPMRASAGSCTSQLQHTAQPSRRRPAHRSARYLPLLPARARPTRRRQSRSGSASTGVSAGTAKRFQVFSTPAARATRDMKPMYGNIQRVITHRDRSKAFRPAAHQPHQHRRRRHTQHAGGQQRPGQHGGHGVDQAVRVASSPSRLARGGQQAAQRPARMRLRQTSGATDWGCGRPR